MKRNIRDFSLFFAAWAVLALAVGLADVLVPDARNEIGRGIVAITIIAAACGGLLAWSRSKPTGSLPLTRPRPDRQQPPVDPFG